jgi:hypothetical protein
MSPLKTSANDRRSVPVASSVAAFERKHDAGQRFSRIWLSGPDLTLLLMIVLVGFPALLACVLLLAE